MARLKDKYVSEVVPALQQKFQYKNVNEIPRLEKIRGLEMIFVTTAKTDEEAKELLRLLGMPFEQA